MLEASHDGYHRRYELIHSRRLQLSADGLRLEGCDRLDGLSTKVRLRTDLPFAIHFHLLPGASCGLGAAPNEAIITLADGQRWRVYRARRCALHRGKRLLCRKRRPAPRAQQIVLRGATFGETEVNWVAARMAEDNRRE